MNSNISNQLESYLSQLRTLETNLRNFSMEKEPRERTGELFTEWLIGEGAKEILKSDVAGKLGRKLIRDQFKTQDGQKYRQFISDQENYFQNLLNQIRGFLSIISAKRKTLTEKGNSNLLLKKLSTIENYAKLETRVRRTITIVNQLKVEDLIFNSEITNFLEQEKSPSQKDSYEKLKNLEQKLRRIIESELSKISSDWWNQRVPEDVKTNASIRKKKNESPWSWITGGSPIIDYIDFTDYAKIITKRDNWENSFKHIFHDREWIAVKLRELEPIRNDIAHSRNLSQSKTKRLQLNAEDIIRIIKN